MCYSSNREEFGPSLQSWCNSEEACRPFGSYRRCQTQPASSVLVTSARQAAMQTPRHRREAEWSWGLPTNLLGSTSFFPPLEASPSGPANPAQP